MFAMFTCALLWVLFSEGNNFPLEKWLWSFVKFMQFKMSLLTSGLKTLRVVTFVNQVTVFKIDLTPVIVLSRSFLLNHTGNICNCFLHNMETLCNISEVLIEKTWQIKLPDNIHLNFAIKSI